MRVLCCAWVALCCATIAQAQTPPPSDWSEARTPHFVVDGDVPAEELRFVGLELERIRAAYAHVTNALHVDPGTPETVLVTQHESINLRFPGDAGPRKPWSLSILPEEYTRQYIYFPSSEGTDFSQISYRFEDLLGRCNFRWMPFWFQAGLGSNFYPLKMDDHYAVLGDAAISAPRDPDPRVIPLERLLAWRIARESSPTTAEKENNLDLHFTARVLVNMLISTPDVEHNWPLKNFIDLLDSDVTSREALTRVLGSPNVIESKMILLARSRLTRVVVPAPPSIPLKEIPVRRLSQAELAALAGDYAFQEFRLSDARELLETALRLDPKLVTALETLGLVAIDEGKFEEARERFGAAAAIDANSFMAHYGLGITAGRDPIRPWTTAELAKTELARAIELNPAFAPSYAALADVHLQLGTPADVAEALELAGHAVWIEPGNPYYSLRYASALIANQQIPVAERVLHRVMRFSTSRPAWLFEAQSDMKKIEAAGNTSSQAARNADGGAAPGPDGPPLNPASSVPALGFTAAPNSIGSSEVEGKIAEVSCNGFELRLTLKLPEKTLQFKSEDYVAVRFENAERKDQGLNPCSELRGHNARVIFLARPNGTEEGELRAVIKLAR